MSRAAALGLCVLLAVLAGACAGGSATGPPEIAYDRDVCDECHMIISDWRFAAAYRTEDGSARKFDDIGDMVAYGVRMGELADARAWVHDYLTGEWVDARRATYLRGARVETPMDRQLIAFASRRAADRYRDRAGGTRVAWRAVVADAGGAPAGSGTTAGSGTGAPP